MKVDFIDYMGSDLTVANAARVSFDKQSEWDIVGYETQQITDRSYAEHPIRQLSEKDKKLINFLAKHNHWTPFGHCSLQFRIKAPIFVARQLGKHQVGLVWNEISRRYVDSEPEFYFPENWRKKNPDKKQGSFEDQFVNDLECSHPYMIDINSNLGASITSKTTDIAKLVSVTALNTYKTMLDAGICPEQARMILPQNMYTEWYWSGTLFAFARICKLRLKPDTQKETREIAEMINEFASKAFPISWNALMCKE
jgi:thymidylate synthase (FAD)